MFEGASLAAIGYENVVKDVDPARAGLFLSLDLIACDEREISAIRAVNPHWTLIELSKPAFVDAEEEAA